MIIAEPTDLFLNRAYERERRLERERREFQYRVSNSTEHEDGWDDTIMAYFGSRAGQVVLYMRAVNAISRQCQAKRKRDRERAKIIVIRSIGRLIREGRLKRVRRRFVRVNEAEVPHVMVIPMGTPAQAGLSKLQARVSERSTKGQKVIHPAIFL
jgi:hypothetical protein